MADKEKNEPGGRREDEREKDEGSTKRQRTVVVSDPCGTKSRALYPSARARVNYRPSPCAPSNDFFSGDRARFLRDSTRFICVYARPRTSRASSPTRCAATR